MKLLSDASFLSWPGKSVNLNFRQYQYKKTVKNSIVAWKFDLKWLQESLYALSTLLNYLQTKFISDINILSWPSKSVNTLSFPTPILQKQLKLYLFFQKSLKNGCNNLYFHRYSFNMSYKSFSYLTPLSRRGR